MRQNLQSKKSFESELESFFDQLSSLLSVDRILEPELEHLPVAHALTGECIYIVDILEKRLTHASGFEKLLGYPDEEVDFTFFFKGYHPEDIGIIKEVIRSVSVNSLPVLGTDPDQKLSITFRRKRKDGSYIHLLSETKVHEIDSKGHVVKMLTRLIDISYLNLNTPVSWSFRSKYIDEDQINFDIFHSYENPFTNREIEVIKEIEKGGSNHDIGNRLCVSHHTIATHRKNIFRKCNCNNILDLMLYCKRWDIL